MTIITCRDGHSRAARATVEFTCSGCRRRVVLRYGYSTVSTSLGVNVKSVGVEIGRPNGPSISDQKGACCSSLFLP